MKSYYTESQNYRFWASRIFPSTETSRREKIVKPSLERVISACEHYQFRPKCLVEIGPGFGTFLQAASDSGYFGQVLGVEPTPELAEACGSRGLHVLPKPVEMLKASEMPADSIVVAFEVIEHLYDPSEFLLAIHQVLSDGALLILSFPNGKGFDVELLRERSTTVDLEHVNLFNAVSIEELLHRTGYSLLECSTPGRLDVELVREIGLDENLEFGPFFNHILFEAKVDVRDALQGFLSQNGLSSHMWVVARKA